MAKTVKFEKSLEQLETIVERMESGDLSLEESLKLFEQGVLLSKTCQTALENAQQRVQVLMADTEDNISDESE